jgi:outer membrane protein
MIWGMRLREWQWFGVSVWEYVATLKSRPEQLTQLRRLGLLSLLALLGTQAGDARAITLQDALAQAYETNPELQAARAGFRAAQQDISRAKALWRPVVSMTATSERASGNGKSGLATYEYQEEAWKTEFVAAQPILSSGRFGARRAEAEARVRGAKARLGRREQDLLAAVANGYVQVARNEAVMDHVRDDIASLRKVVGELTALSGKGVITDSDVAQAEGAIAAARALCLANLAELQASWKSLAALTGLETQTRPSGGQGDVRANPCIDVSGPRLKSDISMPALVPRAPASLEAAEAMAQDEAPSVAAARATEEETQHAISNAKAAFLPSATLNVIAVAAGQELGNPSLNREASIAATIRVPLYNAGVEYAELRAARERNNEARIQVEATQRAVSTEVSRQWYRLVSLRATRRVTRDQVNSLARAYATLRKEIGVASQSRSVADILALRGALLNARISMANSDRDQVIAIFQLLAAMGQLSFDLAGVTAAPAPDAEPPEAPLPEAKP